MNSYKYIGDYKYNKKNGNGILYYNNTILYNGQWLNNSYHGYGELFFSNGNIQYQGEWNNNHKSGLGILFYKNKNIKYEGQWLNNIPNGFGTYYNNDGSLLYKGLSHNINIDMKKFINDLEV